MSDTGDEHPGHRGRTYFKNQVINKKIVWILWIIQAMPLFFYYLDVDNFVDKKEGVLVEIKEKIEKAIQLGIIERYTNVIPDRKNKVSSQIIKTKGKVITINVDEEFIENSLIELPFIYYGSDNENINIIRYAWKTNDGSDRAIDVACAYGIPGPFDYDVLLAILRIFIRQYNDTIFIDDSELLYDRNIDTKVYFTYSELARELGYKTTSSKVLNAIKKSIIRLSHTKITNTWSGGIYDPIKKQFITDASFTINIITTAASYTSEKDKHDKTTKVFVDIDRFFINNIFNGKGKISDKALRLSLKLSVSRRLYILLNKWKADKNSMVISLERLYERIPLPEHYDRSYKRKTVKRALEELTAKCFLASFEITKDSVVLYFNLDTEDEHLKLESENWTQGTNIAVDNQDNVKKDIVDIINDLKKYGFSELEIKHYARLDNIEKLSNILIFVEKHLSYIKDPKSYIIGSMI